MRPLAAAADLVLGARCAACGVAALLWCRDCAERTRPMPRRLDGHRLPVAAAAENTGTVADLIVAWKDGGRHGLVRPLALLLATACVEVIVEEPVVTLVPVPSMPAQVRQRGADVVADMARRAAGNLAAVGVSAFSVPALRRVRRTRDQVGLGARERRQNVAGAFATTALARRIRGRVVVVDDVLTTGASAHEATRALTREGFAPLGIAVVAHTPPPGRQGVGRLSF